MFIIRITILISEYVYSCCWTLPSDPRTEHRVGRPHGATGDGRLPAGQGRGSSGQVLPIPLQDWDVHRTTEVIIAVVQSYVSCYAQRGRAVLVFCYHSLVAFRTALTSHTVLHCGQHYETIFVATLFYSLIHNNV